MQTDTTPTRPHKPHVLKASLAPSEPDHVIGPLKVNLLGGVFNREALAIMLNMRRMSALSSVQNGLVTGPPVLYVTLGMVAWHVRIWHAHVPSLGVHHIGTPWVGHRSFFLSVTMSP